MTLVLKESLKTQIKPYENVLVFSTNKSLHERFTRKYQRCVFILNNGYTAPFKNNAVKERIVFPYRKKIGSDYFNDERNEISVALTHKESAASELIQLARNRRIVLLPKKLKYNASDSCDIDDQGLDTQHINLDCNTPEPCCTPVIRKHDFVARRRFGRLDNPLRKDLRGFRRYSVHNLAPSRSLFRFKFENKNSYPPYLYKWKRKPISKAQLDDEIDTYMAEIKFKPPAPASEDIEPFLEEYLRETEQFLDEKGEDFG